MKSEASDKVDIDKDFLRFVCISDTHKRHRFLEIPDGDVLIHAGDFTRFHKSSSDLRDFNTWLGKLPHRYKIVIAGNHDKALEGHSIDEIQTKLLSNCTHYLQDTSVLIDGRVKVHGAPWTPKRNWKYWADGFELEPGLSESSDEFIGYHWAQIPRDVDVLITHAPPVGVRDANLKMQPMGCEFLLAQTLINIRPKIHVFGHNHGGHGGSLFKSENNPELLAALKELDLPTQSADQKASVDSPSAERNFEIVFLNVAQVERMKAFVFDFYTEN